MSRKLKISFSGYAHVHFACFRPLYEALRRVPGVEVSLSGGLRTLIAGGGEPDSNDQVSPKLYRYDGPALYGPFGVPAREIIPVEELARRDVDIAFAANTNVIRPRAARLTAQIFHGISFRNKAVRSAQLASDLFFVVGPYMRRRFAETGLLPFGDPRALEIGFPKTDALVNGTVDASALKARHGFTSGRKLVLFAPTGQRGNSLEKHGEELVRRLDADGRYEVIVKLHDHPKDTSIDWRARLGGLPLQRTRISSDLDVVPLLAAADLLVTDASSVSSEFALTGRPVVFVDVPELISSATAAAESALDLDTWGRKGGTVVSGIEELAEACAAALANPGHKREVREAMARDLFYNPGCATRVALGWLWKHLELPFARTMAQTAVSEAQAR